jgi:hypothetical protein
MSADAAASSSIDPGPGYAYGRDDCASSPLSLEDLERLKAAVGLTEDDQRWLKRMAPLVADRAGEMVDTWRAQLSEHPHLARYSARPDGSKHEEYSAASRPRFARWIVDLCARPYDRTWLDYQEEIGLRHTLIKKNRTDAVEAAEDHIPMRYLLAFSAVVMVTMRGFLRPKVVDERELDAMHAAWCKAVMLHVTLWTRPYATAELW